jgi:hypothetical protein
VKVLIVLLCALGLLAAQSQEGDFNIRFEPTAKLQTNVEVPFSITVRDSLRKPLPDAKVTLQIETKEGMHVKVFPASAISPGAYIAKPVFPISGEWNVYVEVRRGNELSARTIQFQVSE